MINKAFNVAKNRKYDKYQCGLASMVCKFFDKRKSGGATTLARSETLAMQSKSAIKINRQWTIFRQYLRC